MSHYLKIALSRWSASLALASLLAVSVFGFTSIPAFAGTCDLTTPLDATTSLIAAPVNCTMTVGFSLGAGALTLRNSPTAAVTGGPFTPSGADLSGAFSFTSLVSDHRGSAAGWMLSASSPGLSNGTTTIPLALTAEDTAAGKSSCTGACVATIMTPIIMGPGPGGSTGVQTFLTSGNGTTIIDGDYTNVTDGTFLIPAGSSSGDYSATVTIALTNAF
jgi:hypothetical protein